MEIEKDLKCISVTVPWIDIYIRIIITRLGTKLHQTTFYVLHWEYQHERNIKPGMGLISV